MTVLLGWVLVAFLIALVLGRAIYQSECTEQPVPASLPEPSLQGESSPATAPEAADAQPAAVAMARA